MQNIIDKRGNQTIKQWEIELGVKVIKPTGFIGERNKIYNQKYTRKAFKRGAKGSILTTKTEKGLDFIESL